MAAPVVGASDQWLNAAGVNAGLGATGYSPVPLGTAVSQKLDLPRGRWDVSLQYQSPAPLRVTGPGLELQLPASLGPPGPFWSAGSIRSDGGEVTIGVAVDTMSRLARPEPAWVGTLAATRVDLPRRDVPLARACGRYVDWYVREP